MGYSSAAEAAWAGLNRCKQSQINGSIALVEMGGGLQKLGPN